MTQLNAGISYRQHVIEDRWDAIVVGSGIGGLTTAALLSKHAGKKVLVLERHYAAGGYTHTFLRPGYEWDVGVHYIGRNAEVHAAFDHLTDGQLKWSAMPDVYDRFLTGDRTYDFPSGVERFRSQMKRYFPSEGAAIDGYIEAVQSCVKASRLYYAEKALPRPMAWIAGGFLRSSYLRWAGRTTAEVLRELTPNRELAGVLTAQWGNYGLPPEKSSFGIHATITHHYFEGAMYPAGGANRIAAAMEPLITRNGGRIVTRAEVADILIENEKAIGVRMTDGREFRAGLIISDVGAHNTFGRLVHHQNRALAALRKELAAVPPSTAHLCLYVGVKQTASQLGLDGTNLWITPGYDHDTCLERFSKDPSAPFPMIFISFPSAKDPDFERRHPGRATMEVVALAPYEWFARWEDAKWKHRGADYDAFKQSLAVRLQRELEKHVPAVAGKIDYAELSTPLSTRNFMNYEKGEAYGLSSTPARFRLHGLTPHTPIRRLYLTGQDVTSHGVTGALAGGVVSASAILGRNLVSTVFKPLGSMINGVTPLARI